MAWCSRVPQGGVGGPRRGRRRAVEPVNRDARADASKYRGGNAKVTLGMNRLLDAVGKPIVEATDVLGELARRNLRARVKGDYQGEYAKIKEALNATAEELHDAMSQVAQAVDQVSSTSAEIASSQAVANGASEQASSLEETSSTLGPPLALQRWLAHRSPRRPVGRWLRRAARRSIRGAREPPARAKDVLVHRRRAVVGFWFKLPGDPAPSMRRRGCAR
jgi:uncharacterized protein YukE